MRSVEWDRRQKLRHLRGNAPGDASPKTEAGHPDPCSIRKGLTLQIAPAAFEVLYKLVGGDIAQRARDVILTDCRAASLA
jgi:hypothetical protein